MSRARFVAIVLAAGYGGLMAGGLSAANGLGAVKRPIPAGAVGVLLSLGAYMWESKRLQAANEERSQPSRKNTGSAR